MSVKGGFETMLSRNAERHSYQQPEAVGWAAWWTMFGMVVAFEHLDGTIIAWSDQHANP